MGLALGDNQGKAGGSELAGDPFGFMLRLSMIFMMPAARAEVGVIAIGLVVVNADQSVFHRQRTSDTYGHDVSIDTSIATSKPNSETSWCMTFSHQQAMPQPCPSMAVLMVAEGRRG